MTSHRPTRLFALGCIAACLAGCATRIPLNVTMSEADPPIGRSRLEMHDASFIDSLASPAPTPMQAAPQPLDEPAAGREPASRRAWPDPLAAAARQLQPEALRQGAIAIDRISADHSAGDRLSIRIALGSAFSGRATRPNPALAPFFAKVAATLSQHPDLCSTVAEDRAASPRRSRALRPYPRAAAVRRALMDSGVDPGRLAVELEPAPRDDDALRLPSEFDEDGSLALSIYRCEG